MGQDQLANRSHKVIFDANDRFIVLPRFRGHTIIVVEIQQEVFHGKVQKLSKVSC